MEIVIWDPSSEEVKPLDTLLAKRLERKGGILGGEVIYSEPLAKIREDNNLPIDLTDFITPCRYRFIDCLEFVEQEKLRIVETPHLPIRKYAAVSHVWASLPAREDSLNGRGFFLVKCEEHNNGGPISIDVLHHTCLAALQERIRYLWLDRLCILQTETAKSKDDKKWQILNMHGIYFHSCISLVLLAGLQRFPTKREETDWIDRAWTFQEVMVSPESKVLFIENSALSSAGPRMLPIADYFSTWYPPGDLPVHDVWQRERRNKLVKALNVREQFRRNELSDVLTRFHTIWDWVQWRKSAHQVDVIFSVMGMLDIMLDPSHFHRDDRFGATTAIAQEMLLKDPADNSCVEIPLWKRISKSRVDMFKQQRELNVKTYMMSLPSLTELANFELELEQDNVEGFASATKVSVIYGSHRNKETTKLTPDELKKLRGKVNASVWGRPEDAFQYLLTNMEHGGVDNVSRMRQEADRISKLIPKPLMWKVACKTGTGVYNPFYDTFKTDGDIAIGICKRLSPVPSRAERVEASIEPNSDETKYVFGWCVQSGLWLGRGGYSVNESTPVPILTFWKFRVPDTLDEEMRAVLRNMNLTTP
ncbi:hypothetical protein VKT23_017388 [Stygiomarasmius scandens]|uniref:Heterokaryon incompatibility domain-containing protein n=1 Tax=Marasmiellus scandens TaxID=2682957 RepID=A0ABR1IUM5_9AGAR